jgi:alginate O-acetyltransferase complex protein AlgJ
MLKAKLDGQQVFLRTDTHWTPEGAQIAAEALAKTIAEKAPLSGEPQHFVTEPAEKVTHKGDLRLFLPLDPLFENLMPKTEPLQKRNTVAAQDQAGGDDALFANTEVPVALIGTSYSANPNWNFVGALKQALNSDVVNYAEDSPPQVLIWEFPERYLPVNNEIGDADPQWVAELKEAGVRQQNVAANTKSETPDRAQN